MADPGIGVGAGGMIASLFNPGLASSVAQHITPNPNPLTQQGQPGDGTVDTLGNPTRPNLAQPAVTQPDPANAANVARLANPPDSSAALDYMRYQRMGQLSDSLNHSIYGIAAGFGTAQQQASKQAALRGGDGTVGGGLGDLAGIQALQDKTIQDNEHARFMANAAVFAQSLSQAIGRPVSIAEATEWMNNKDTMQAATQAMGSGLTPTEGSKDFKAAQTATAEQVKADHPDWSQAQIQAEVNRQVPPSLMLHGLGNLSDQEYQQYAAAERAAGRVPIGPTAWAEQNKVSAVTQETRAKDTTESKDQAVLDYPQIDQSLTRSQDAIKKLLANLPATIKAIQTPEFMKTGLWAANAPSLLTASDDVKAQAAVLDQLNNALAGEGLKTVKNVRNVREFNALAGALSAGLKPGNTAAGIRSTLEGLQDRFAGTRAIAREQAGLPPEEAAKDDFSKMSTGDADKAYEALPPGATFTDTDGKRKRKP
jgi:hypothetical protein